MVRMAAKAKTPTLAIGSDMKSEGRNPKPERRPKSEIRRRVSARSVRVSDFGLLSGFGFRPSDFSRSAFTLIELMVVIVLIGILTAMIIPEMKGTYEDALLRATSRELVDVFSLASSRAASLNKIHRIRLNQRTGHYVVEQRLRAGPLGDEYARVEDMQGSEGDLDTRISLSFRRPGEYAPAQDEAAPPEPPGAEPDQGMLERAITFYPDGTAEGGDILLRDRQGFQLVLHLNQVTARVHLIELARE